MKVELAPSEGRQGELVRVRVTPANATAVTGVNVSVDGYGVNVSLYRQGDAWVGEEPVPYEADPGRYDLTVRAYDESWHTMESAQATFTVL